MKKTLFIILALISFLIYLTLKTAPSLERVKTKIFGQYSIWVGTAAFSSSDCTSEYKETQDKIKYFNLCSGLENIIFKTQVLKIEKGECYCYKTEYK